MVITPCLLTLASCLFTHQRWFAVFVILEGRYVGGFHAEALGKEKKCHSAVATALEVLKTQSLLLAPRGKESYVANELFFGEIGKIIVYEDFLHT